MLTEENYLYKCNNLQKELDEIYKNAYNYVSIEIITDFMEKMIKTLGQPFLSSFLIETIKTKQNLFRYINKLKEFIEEIFCESYIHTRIEFINSYSEQKFDFGKKIVEYLEKIGLFSLSYEANKNCEKFCHFYNIYPKYDELNIIDTKIFNDCINTDLVIRFSSAIASKSKYVPGEFVLVKLGKMPGRILNGLPRHAKVYAAKSEKNQVSAGIILDVINDKEIKVIDHGRWYKVAISTPFSMFCIEERHLKKYAPTSDNVKNLLERSIEATVRS